MGQHKRGRAPGTPSCACMRFGTPLHPWVRSSVVLVLGKGVWGPICLIGGISDPPPPKLDGGSDRAPPVHWWEASGRTPWHPRGCGGCGTPVGLVGTRGGKETRRGDEGREESSCSIWQRDKQPLWGPRGEGDGPGRGWHRGAWHPTGGPCTIPPLSSPWVRAQGTNPSLGGTSRGASLTPQSQRKRIFYGGDTGLGAGAPR